MFSSAWATIEVYNPEVVKTWNSIFFAVIIIYLCPCMYKVRSPATKWQMTIIIKIIFHNANLLNYIYCFLPSTFLIPSFLLALFFYSAAWRTSFLSSFNPCIVSCRHCYLQPTPPTFWLFYSCSHFLQPHSCFFSQFTSLSQSSPAMYCKHCILLTPSNFLHILFLPISLAAETLPCH